MMTGHDRVPRVGYRGHQGSTHRARDHDAHATALLVNEESIVRSLIEEKLGDIIFGVDDQSMEDVVAAQLLERDFRSRSPSP